MEQVLLRYKRVQVIRAHCSIKFSSTICTCLVASNIMCPTLIEASQQSWHVIDTGQVTAQYSCTNLTLPNLLLLLLLLFIRPQHNMVHGFGAATT